MSVCGIDGCTREPYHPGLCHAAVLTGRRCRRAAPWDDDSKAASSPTPSASSDHARSRQPGEQARPATPAERADQPLGLTEELSAASLAFSTALYGGPEKVENHQQSASTAQMAAKTESGSEAELCVGDAAEPVCGLQGCVLKAYHAGLCQVPPQTSRRAAASAAFLNLSSPKLPPPPSPSGATSSIMASPTAEGSHTKGDAPAPLAALSKPATSLITPGKRPAVPPTPQADAQGAGTLEERSTENGRGVKRGAHASSRTGGLHGPRAAATLSRRSSHTEGSGRDESDVEHETTVGRGDGSELTGESADRCSRLHPPLPSPSEIDAMNVAQLRALLQAHGGTMKKSSTPKHKLKAHVRLVIAKATADADAQRRAVLEGRARWAKKCSGEYEFIDETPEPFVSCAPSPHVPPRFKPAKGPVYPALRACAPRCSLHAGGPSCRRPETP